MEILHIGKFYAPERGGMETALQGLAAIGEELGHSVSCVVARRAGAPTPDASSVGLTAYLSRREIFSAPLPWKLLKHDLSSAEVLHLHLPNPLAELAVLLQSRRSKRTKLIPFVHALPVRQGILGKIWHRTITRLLLNRSERILVSNPHMLTAFPELAKWERKIQVVPFFARALCRTELKEIENARATSHRVLAIGRLVSYKGFYLLLQAWHEAVTSTPRLRRWKLEIIGEGREFESLRRTIKNLSLENQVDLLGNCSEEEKDIALRRASIFIAPSLSAAETFGLSVLEAMAYALPVITTDLPTGLQDLSRKGTCGAEVEAGSRSALTAAIQKLAAISPAERHRIGRANYDFQSCHYTREQSSDLYKICLHRAQTESPAEKPGSI